MLNCRPVGVIEVRVRQIENATLSTFDAETQHVISSSDQLCFPPDSSSILQTPTEPEGKPSSP
jgi:hypothetical protein